MGLKYTCHLFPRIKFPHRPDTGAQLFRMMRIIVDVDQAIPVDQNVEPASNPCETLDSPLQIFLLNPCDPSYSQRGDGILQVKHTGHSQHKTGHGFNWRNEVKVD